MAETMEMEDIGDEENKSEGYNLNSNNKEESKNSENIHEM